MSRTMRHLLSSACFGFMALGVVFALMAGVISYRALTEGSFFIMSVGAFLVFASSFCTVFFYAFRREMMKNWGNDV